MQTAAHPTWSPLLSFVPGGVTTPAPHDTRAQSSVWVNYLYLFRSPFIYPFGMGVGEKMWKAEEMRDRMGGVWLVMEGRGSPTS